MMKTAKFYCFFTCLTFFLFTVPYNLVSQEVNLLFSASGRFRILERSNFAKYVDNVYIGHVYRENRALIDGENIAEGIRFEGNFLVFEETLHDTMLAAKMINEEIPSKFIIKNDGSIIMLEDKGYPVLRSFPALPGNPVSTGDKWQSNGFRAIDPDNSGIITRLQILAEYEYAGTGILYGSGVHMINARYATRYKQGQDRKGDPNLAGAQGTHAVKISLDINTGAPIMTIDNFDETFTYINGKVVRFKGFTVTFFQPVTPLDGIIVINSLQESMGEKQNTGVENTEVVSSKNLTDDQQTFAPDNPENTIENSNSISDGLKSAGLSPLREDESFPELELGNGISAKQIHEGIRLTINDVRFVPDQDTILPEENWRLDIIAEALAKTGDRSILIAGHTANVGLPEHEMELSIKRAKRIVDELVKRNIPASRFIYLGYGATRPVAPNDTETNKAKNRRVEITILED